MYVRSTHERLTADVTRTTHELLTIFRQWRATTHKKRSIPSTAEIENQRTLILHEIKQQQESQEQLFAKRTAHAQLEKRKQEALHTIQVKFIQQLKEQEIIIAHKEQEIDTLKKNIDTHKKEIRAFHEEQAHAEHALQNLDNVIPRAQTHKSSMQKKNSSLKKKAVLPQLGSSFNAS